MTMRKLGAGLLGGIAMFIWSAVAHMATPLGEAGIAEIPNESAVAAAMQGSMGDKAGLYIFPGPGLGPEATKEERHKAMEQLESAYATKPSGLLMYHPPGHPFNFPRHLGIEFGTEVIESLLAVFLLGLTTLSCIPGRTCFVFGLGCSPPSRPIFPTGTGMDFPRFTRSVT